MTKESSIVETDHDELWSYDKQKNTGDDLCSGSFIELDFVVL